MKIKIETQTRLDWLTFSYPIAQSSPKFYQQYLRAIRNVLHFETFHEKSTESSLFASGRDIYFAFHSKSCYIQFRGTFFMRKSLNSFLIIRQLIGELNFSFSKITKEKLGEEFSNVLFTISRVDVARDFPNTLPDEIMKPFFNPTYSKKFKCQLWRIGDPTETISLVTKKWQNRCYDKKLEVFKNKNKEKQIWLNENYPDAKSLVRFELQINESSRNKDNTFLFYQPECDEQTLCAIAMRDFYSTHKILRPSGNEVLAWKNLFILSEDLEITRTKSFNGNLLIFNAYKKFSTQTNFNMLANSDIFADTDFETKVKFGIDRALELKAEAQIKNNLRQNITDSYFHELLKKAS